jgi:acetyl-CoA carboxylase carboxyl transferase subunit alpha
MEAAAALKLTAPDLLKAAIIDEIIPEPIGGAHTDPAAAAALVDAALSRSLAEVAALDSQTRSGAAVTRSFRRMGRVGIEFTEG